MDTWNRLVDAFFNVRVAKETLPLVMHGFVATVELGCLVAVTGMSTGLLLSLVRTANIKIVNGSIVFFADVFRTIPPLVLIVLFYFGLPSAGVSISGFVSSWIALSLVLMAFTEEIFWAGINATPIGQWEAARSTGLTAWQTLRFVVVPQAARLAAAPLTNRTIVTVKGTAYASVVAVPEILGAAQAGVTYTFNATPLMLAAVAYLILFIPVIAIGRRVEKRYTWKV